MKKGFSKILAAAMAGAMLLGSAPSVYAEAPEVKDVVIFTYNYMGNPDQATIDGVLEKVNEIMNPLGVNIKLELTMSSSYWDEFTMRMASGERVDLAAITDNRYSNYVANGSLLPLDDLIEEYGQGIKDAFGGEEELGWLLEATRMNGSLYSIPVIDDKFNCDVVTFQKALIDKYGLDYQSIKTIADIEPLLAVIKENEPAIRPIISGTQDFTGLPATFRCMPDYESLADGLGVLVGEDNWDLINIFETQEYMDYCKMMHEWYEKGYVASDIATSGENADAYYKTGNAFCYMANGTYIAPENYAASVSVQYGVDSVSVSTGPTKARFLKFLEVVPVTAENPEGAMIFLNELYTNKELLDLWYYGIEGVDYTRGEDVVDIDMSTQWSADCGTCFPMMFGNYYLATDRALDGAGYKQKEHDLLMNCERSRSLGFYFDATNVATEITAVQNVLAEYQPGLDYGILDPEVEIPNFIEKLKAAGIEDIIAEKQAQLNEWVKVNGK